MSRKQQHPNCRCFWLPPIEPLRGEPIIKTFWDDLVSSGCAMHNAITRVGLPPHVFLGIPKPMPTTNITREFQFDAGHRVYGHESKCSHLHGHRYKAEITITAPELDTLGRVADFGWMKDIIGGWIDDNWDHNMILNPDDPLAKLWTENEFDVFSFDDGLEHKLRDIFGSKKPYLMPMHPVTSTFDGGMNPTAENMARVLWDVITPGLPEHVKLVRVTLWETPNCKAEYCGLFHTTGY
jgi:6-pyruvoyltetrahydropterin/6-carboxytetrahydropterin synthase